MGTTEGAIRDVDVRAYTIPTDAPEADGTFSWNSTTLIVAELHCGEVCGLGYTYGNAATAVMAKRLAEQCLVAHSPFDIQRLHHSMVAAVRNDGSRGICAMAISALDIALWDAKAKLLACSVVQLLGAAQTAVDAYGSGGFTSYSDDQLTKQLSQWAEAGLRSVKIKIGSHPDADPRRVHVAREAIGDDVALFVDANGAFSARQAITFAARFAEDRVSWFEEPVSSDRLADMRRVRDAAPLGMDIAAGEYGYDPLYFRRMLDAEAVDVLQLDATRCRGFTGFLQSAAVASSFGMPLSAHCAPSLHMHVGCAVPGLRNIEYFHDHARIERILFDGFIAPDKDGKLQPDRSRVGLGLCFKRTDAERFAA
jgi:L-alanine-DL-glutamate epimerase-like enolase superfamily enzyme